LNIVQQVFADAERSLPRKAEQTPIFSRAIGLLQALRGAEIKVGVISADTLQNVQDFIDLYKIKSYVQLQMGIESGPSKPDPALLHYACEALAVPVEHVLMIGDADADMQMARAAGAAGAIGVSWGWQSLLPPLTDADVMISDFNQIQIFC
jgi:phosphoglycolate phosphatase